MKFISYSSDNDDSEREEEEREKKRERKRNYIKCPEYCIKVIANWKQGNKTKQKTQRFSFIRNINNSIVPLPSLIEFVKKQAKMWIQYMEKKHSSRVRFIREYTMNRKITNKMFVS